MKNLICLYIIILFTSCSDRKEIVFEEINRFKNEQNEWNGLTKRILNDNTVKQKLGQIIEPEELSETLNKELSEKGIISLTVGNTEDCKKVEYQKAWKNSIGTQYIEWTTCDTIRTQNGYYEDLSPIEVFGIGNNWLTWIDIDPI